MKLSVLLLVLFPVLLFAEASPWETALAARQMRADLLRDEIKALDARIEGRLDHIIDGVAGIADSKDSKTKVARLKEQTVEGLRKNMGYYQTKRADLQQQLRQPSMNLTAEQKHRLLAALDARVNKRVQQIIQLQNSFPPHKDYDRYKVTGSGWSGTEYERNTDFEQNRRVTTHTNQMQEKVLDGLGQSIARLEQQQRLLKAAPASDVVKAEMARNEGLLKERRAQRADVLEATPTTGREVNLKQAMDLDGALKRAGDELRRDFTTLFARYNAYLPTLADANTARTQAALAKKN